MARDPRFIPPGALVEITTRTMQGRFLLRPSRDLNEIVLSNLAREAGRLHLWGERFWGRRYRGIKAGRQLGDGSRAAPSMAREALGPSLARRGWRWTQSTDC